MGPEVADLHEVLDKLGYTVAKAEVDAQLYGASTEERVRAFQRDHELAETGIVDEETVAVLGASPEVARLGRTVSGTVVLDSGLPAAGITIRAYDRGYGGRDEKLNEGKTDDGGSYSLAYRAVGDVNLELRAVDPDGKEIPLSETKFGAGRQERFDLVAPGSIRPLAPEYDRLAADLEHAIGGFEALGQAREGGGRADLSIASERSRWDARLLALAATAAKVSERANVPPEALYALYRTGMPTDPSRLARVDASLIDKALERAVGAGIIGNGDGRVRAARDAIAAFQRTQRREAKAPGAVSSLGDLFASAGLPEDQQTAFEEVYFSTPSDQLWKAASRRLPADAVSRLQTQGKLGALTLNNAPLMKALERHVETGTGAAGLVDAGYFDAGAWETTVRGLASDGTRLDDLIPTAYAAETTDDRVAAYATDMARKVRLAFPTRVVGHMLEAGELKLGEDAKTVGTFLKKASEQGFELGRMPVEQLFNGGGGIERPEDHVVDGVKAVQRVFQITPSNEAMSVLLDEGIYSASDIVAFGHDRFVSLYGEKFKNPGEGELVYRKSDQVSSVTYGLFTSARALDSSTPVHAISGDATVVAAAKAAVTKQYPTMEQLFGSLDFCECEECRSVLSPAAYFVDLLQYLNPAKLVWDAFTTNWNGKHAKTFAPNFAADYDKPFDQLDHRRPDLKSLPLTCENTNTALPYIDVVNEILEYYVAHGSLAGDEGRDTGDASSQELLAEPQYILAPAYQTLLGQTYPLGLPFDLWIATVRGFLAYFDTPLWQLLETFRATDELFDPQTGASAPYYRSQIFVESLGISPAEWALFTKDDPGASWWTLYGYADDNAARTALASAKTLSRQLGLTYKQLTQIIETAFFNPQLAELVTLSKIGIDVGDVYRYKNAPGAAPMTAGERTAFEQQLAQFQTDTGFDATAWLNARWADQSFDKVLVLADSDPGCNFDKTKLQYANGDPVTAVDWVKLNLFVRLWRRLGWKIEEVDRALTALMPKNELPLTSANIGSALGTAIIYIAHLNSLVRDLAVGKNARLKLPTLWTDISTKGPNSLYAQLFLTPRALKNDPIFDNPIGDYLSDNTKLLKDHRAGVQAALTLTARAVDAILADAGINPNTAPLSLANVSVLYRYGLLARALKLSVPDLVTLKKLSGLDPLAALDPDALNADHTQPPVSPIADDHPFSQTIRFVEVAKRVAASGFSIAELEYLLVHDPDSVDRFRPDEAPALTLLKSLRAEIARIRNDNRPPDDPTTLDDDTLRQKLALVLPGPTVDAFMAMWAGTIEYNARKENVLPADKLDPAPLAGQALVVAYDAVMQEQHLRFTGVLLDPQKLLIENADNSPVLAGLLDDVQAQAKAFYDRWFGEFLEPADYATIFAPIPTAPVAAQAAIAARRTAVAAGLFPYVQARLVRQLVVSSLAATLDADPVLVESLVSDADLLHDTTAAPGTPLLQAFGSADTAGLSASWYPTTDCTGAPSVDPPPSVDTADTATKPNGTNSARFRGCLQVTEGGPYRFFVHLGKQNASATLAFEQLPNAVIAAIAAADGDEPSAEVDLKPGVPYPFTLEVHDLNGGDARLLVLGESLPKDRLDRLALYPQSVVDRVRRADVVMAKVLRLITGFGLDEREMRHVVTHRPDFSQIDLSLLPASSTTANVADRFVQFLRLAGYAALKRSLELDGSDLVDIFENARRTFAAGANANTSEQSVFNDLCDRIAALTRRDTQTVRVTAHQLGFAATSAVNGGVLAVQAPDFAQERGLQRLWDALVLLENLGVPAEAVGRWVPIVDGAAPNRDAIADDVKSTVKARFEDDAWYSVAQPVFDSLRKVKRDALVTYILDKEGLDSPDRLYERFLLDPEMEPVVQTSRIQLAISSVQLFVQRCLLNLEVRVPPPAIIAADEWLWMKRYRFWHANRRIFLNPEDFLEPEWRDDKTSLYRDLEGSLLQGDVTNDAAEDAFLQYLQGLEAIARLQIVSMYVEEPDDAVDIVHVIGRSYAAPHKYWYRRLSDEVWSPWEPIDVEIDGDHVALVKWRDRLHLFWASFGGKGRPKDDTTTPRTAADVAVDASLQNQAEIRLSWSALVKGTWTPRSSGGPFTVIRADVTKGFDSSTVPIYVTKETRADGSEGAVRIHFAGEIKQGFRIATKNSPPTIVGPDAEPLPTSYYSTTGWNSTLMTGVNQLSIYYPEKVTREDTGEVTEFDAKQMILNAMPQGPWGLLLADGPLQLPRPDLAPLTEPFFYADDTNTFFVVPEVKEDTFDEWDKWVVDDGPDDSGVGIDWWDKIPLEPQIPKWKPPIPDPSDPWIKFEVNPGDDWVTNPATVIEFDGAFVHEQGGIDLVELGGELGRGNVITAGPGSEVGAGTVLVSTPRGDASAFMQGAGVLLVGGAGLNGASLASFEAGKKLNMNLNGAGLGGIR